MIDANGFSLTLENVEEYAETVRREKGMPELPTYYALLLNGICPAGYFTPFSYEAARVFAACGGTSRVSSPDGYYSLAAVYVDACNVIDSKINEIRKIREQNRPEA